MAAGPAKLRVGILPLVVATGAGMYGQRSLGYTVFGGMLAALLATVGGVSIELFNRFDVLDFAWPGGVPWYVFVMATAVVVTIAASLLTTAETLDRRVELAMDL